MPLGYVVSKAGINQLTRASARDLGPFGINVNAIAVGGIVTDMTYFGRKKDEVEQIIEERNKRTALGRAGQPEDIATVAIFLASDDSSFITGQVIAADGGRIGITY